ncbi:MAG: UMP kinase [candidate division Zixibacteria bacterium]|nr:UMP kinase [candidate division Zixibacteria bacterium]
MPDDEKSISGSSKKPGIKYKRVLLKLSGEVLMGDREAGLDDKMINQVCRQVADIRDIDVEVGLVVGGGNIFRGLTAAAAGMDRVGADFMGMLATVINALALQDYLERMGYVTRVMSAIEMPKVCEPFIRRRAIRHMEKDRIVIFAGGTGNPYFTTDTAAALRAAEIDAEVLIKGTKVDGVYDSDPATNHDAVLFDELTHSAVIEKNLRVMDSSAASLCRDNNIPIVVFNLYQKDNLKNIILGKKIGTIVS